MIFRVDNIYSMSDVNLSMIKTMVFISFNILFQTKYINMDKKLRQLSNERMAYTFKTSKVKLEAKF